MDSVTNVFMCGAMIFMAVVMIATSIVVAFLLKDLFKNG